MRLFTVLSLAAALAIAAPASFAKGACRDAHGKFTKCKVEHAKCRDAKGRFTKCKA